MSNLTLWSRPAWDVDRWRREFFGPAAATDWIKPVAAGFSPAAEIVNDAKTRWYSWNYRASTSRRTSPSRSYDTGAGTVRVTGAHAGTQPHRIDIRN
jgi:hypothetical protein